MEKLSSMISTIDDFVWGPVMLILLVGTGTFSDISNEISDLEKSWVCTKKYTE